MENSSISIDTLHLNVRYPNRDIYAKWRQRTEGINFSRLKKYGVLVDGFVVSTGKAGYKISLSQNNARIYLTDRDDDIAGNGLGGGIWIKLGSKFLIEHMNNLHEAVIDLLSKIGVQGNYPIHITRIDIAMCVIRSMAASESGASRPPNPEHVDH